MIWYGTYAVRGLSKYQSQFEFFSVLALVKISEQIISETIANAKSN